MLTAIALSVGTAAGTATGLLFAVGAAAKWRRRAELPGVIANYRLIPPAAARPAAALLIGTEALLAPALLAGGRIGGAAALPAVALLLLFAAAVAINIRRGRTRIDCGCSFGRAGQLLRPALVRRNAGLAIALLPLAGTLLFPPLDPATHAAAAAAGVTAFLLLLLLDALLALPPAGATA